MAAKQWDALKQSNVAAERGAAAAQASAQAAEASNKITQDAFDETKKNNAENTAAVERSNASSGGLPLPLRKARRPALEPTRSLSVAPKPHSMPLETISVHGLV